MVDAVRVNQYGPRLEFAGNRPVCALASNDFGCGTGGSEFNLLFECANVLYCILTRADSRLPILQL